MAAPDFVAVGHVTLDRFGTDVRPGGAALYAALTAHRLGLSVGILTSHGDDFPLDLLPSQIEVVTVAAVTAGAAGALLYVNGERYEIRPRPAREVDPTGAGDVFAAAFLVSYQFDDDPWQAAAVATCAASLSVEGRGWSTVPDRETLTAVLDRYRKID